MLRNNYTEQLLEAGCDEAGRGCLAGPVIAAAVILPKDYNNPLLNDSKQLTLDEREQLRTEILQVALSWAIGGSGNDEIDEINILHASILSMQRAIDGLSIKPQFLLIDGNRFNTTAEIPYKCFVKGDSLFQSIAAASILAKTTRDRIMEMLDEIHPAYKWRQNKGYATESHRRAIRKHGITPLHRKSFNLNEQLKIDFGK
jgi:ribonuclease HII